MNQRLTKRDLALSGLLLLLILLPLSGVWLYTRLRYKPEPNQRFIVQLDSDTTLELLGMDFCGANFPPQQRWRPNGEQLTSQSIFQTRPQLQNTRTAFLQMVQADPGNGLFKSIRIRASDGSFVSSHTTFSESDAGTRTTSTKCYLPVQSKFWPTCSFDILISSRGHQVVASMSDKNEPKSIWAAGQQWDLEFTDVDDRHKERQLQIKYSKPLSDTVSLYVHLIDDQSSGVLPTPEWSETSGPDKAGQFTRRYGSSNPNGFTAVVNVIENDLMIECSNVSVEPGDYTSPRISKVKPSIPKRWIDGE